MTTEETPCANKGYEVWLRPQENPVCQWCCLNILSKMICFLMDGLYNASEIASHQLWPQGPVVVSVTDVAWRGTKSPNFVFVIIELPTNKADPPDVHCRYKTAIVGVGTGRAELLKLTIECRQTDMELQRQHETLHRNPLCYGCKLFMVDFTFEMCLTMLRPAERICMTTFWCGNHNLPVSEQRYDRTFCLTGDRGVEFHYVLVCSFISKNRKKLIRSFYRVSPNLYKFQ